MAFLSSSIVESDNSELKSRGAWRIERLRIMASLASLSFAMFGGKKNCGPLEVM